MLDNKIEQAMKSPVQEVVQRDIDGLKNEIDFRFEKIEKELEDEKQHVKELEVELRTQYKRK